jgi:hypothetical protein
MQHNEFRDGYNRLVIAFPKMPEFTNEIGEVWFPAVEEFTKAEWERGIQDYIKNGRYVPKPSDIRKACFAARERERKERGLQEERCPKCNSAGFFFVEERDGPDTVLLCDCGRCVDKDTPQRMRDRWARQLARALTDEAWELDKSGEVYRFRRKRRWVAEPPPVQDLGKAIESIFPEF